jgi:hypothetical protein
MPVCQVTCETIGRLDEGRFSLVVNRLIAAIVSDIEDRGSDRKKRQLAIKVDFDPISEDRYEVSASADHKLPPYTVAATNARIAQVGGGELGLVFQEQNAANVDQPTLDDVAGARSPDDAGAKQ